jgi:hypothetical protein
MISLPILPRGSTVKPRLVRWGGDLTSALGGPTQRITRPGTRYAVDVELPTLDADCAARWLAATLEADAEGDTLGLVVPQTVPYQGNPNNVKGTGTAGTATLTVSGGAPPVGCWFSFSVGGRNYLHMVVNTQGSNVTVSPALRVSISSLKLEVVKPILEGYPADPPTWEIEFFRFTAQSFTLQENA